MQIFFYFLWWWDFVIQLDASNGQLYEYREVHDARDAVEV